MNLLVASLIILASAGAAIGLLLLLRRYAPHGGFFSSDDRASAVFGVLATGFSVLMAFVVFLAFTSYDRSRSGAETEALLVGQQFETAQFLGPRVAQELTGELVCYARSVVHQEWPRLEAGTEGAQFNQWAVRLFETFRGVEPSTASEQAAYSEWLDQTAVREQARNDRIHGSEEVIPGPVWFILFISAAIVLTYMLSFADRGEGRAVQALLIGTVTAIIVTSLLVIRFLDAPYHPGVGSLRPIAMERTLHQLEQGMGEIRDQVAAPCDPSGTAVGT